MCSAYILLLSCLLVCTCHANNNTKDAIGFPEVEENIEIKNKENRQPVYIPAMCPVNELYYPGDQKDDWICDCRPAYLYHPDSDKCWPAFQQGPCPTGSYLALPQNSVIPVCEKNPCITDTYVSWNGNCERLGSRDPCIFMHPIPAFLGVNATTLVVSCVRNLTFSSRIMVDERDIKRVSNECSPGSKRSINGKCVPL